MRGTFALLLLLTFTLIGACDLRSGIAKDEMEKFSGTPTPTRTPTPPEEPIDPADSVTVDTNQPMASISLDGGSKAKTASCAKFENVTLNGSRSVATIKGNCRQIMINGNGNQVTVEGVMSVVINGEENVLKYSRYINGKRPSVTDNASGNMIEKIARVEVKK